MMQATFALPMLAVGGLSGYATNKAVNGDGFTEWAVPTASILGGGAFVGGAVISALLNGGGGNGAVVAAGVGTGLLLGGVGGLMSAAIFDE